METYPGARNVVLPPDELAAIDKLAGWPQQDIGQAVAIEENQSGGNTAAYNPTDPDGGSIGEFQINGVHGPGGELTPSFALEMSNPEANAKEALGLFESQGWRPWAGDQSLSPPYTSLHSGQAAAQAVGGDTQAQLTSDLTSSSSGGGANPWTPLSWFGGILPGSVLAPGSANETPSTAIGNAAKAGTTDALHALGVNGKSVLRVVLEGVSALAGIGLIGLGLYKASDPDAQHAVDVAGLAEGA